MYGSRSRLFSAIYKNSPHENSIMRAVIRLKNGGRYRIRTYDPLRVKQVL